MDNEMSLEDLIKSLGMPPSQAEDPGTLPLPVDNSPRVPAPMEEPMRAPASVPEPVKDTGSSALGRALTLGAAGLGDGIQNSFGRGGGNALGRVQGIYNTEDERDIRNVELQDARKARQEQLLAALQGRKDIAANNQATRKEGFENQNTLLDKRNASNSAIAKDRNETLLKAAGIKANTAASKTEGQAGKTDAKGEDLLRGEISKKSKDFDQQKGIYDSFNNAYERAGKEKTGIADKFLVIEAVRSALPNARQVPKDKFNLITDSVGLPGKYQQFVEHVSNGGVLTQGQRDDLKDYVDANIQSSAQRHGQLLDEYDTVAKTRGLNSDNVLLNGRKDLERYMKKKSAVAAAPHGDTVQQNGKTYKWDGTTYQAVQ